MGALAEGVWFRVRYFVSGRIEDAVVRLCLVLAPALPCLDVTIRGSSVERGLVLMDQCTRRRALFLSVQVGGYPIVHLAAALVALALELTELVVVR